jgi:hypothetical protein
MSNAKYQIAYRFAYLICGAGMWYYVGTRDKKQLKIIMYNKGYNLSQKFKPYPAWDLYVEPLIINQFSVVFTAGNSFIKGLISDNDNEIKPNINRYVDEVKSELKVFEEEKE